MVRLMKGRPPFNLQTDALRYLKQFRDHPQGRRAPVDPLDIVKGIAHPGLVAFLGRAGHVGGQDDVVQGRTNYGLAQII